MQFTEFRNLSNEEINNFINLFTIIQTSLLKIHEYTNLRSPKTMFTINTHTFKVNKNDIDKLKKILNIYQVNFILDNQSFKLITIPSIVKYFTYTTQNDLSFYYTIGLLAYITQILLQKGITITTVEQIRSEVNEENTLFEKEIQKLKTFMTTRETRKEEFPQFLQISEIQNFFSGEKQNHKSNY